MPNYAMLSARDFGYRDLGTRHLGFAGAGDGINDGVWCQSAKNSTNIGNWKFPDGSTVPNNLNAQPVHMANAPGQVGLLRVPMISLNMFPYQGLYTCTILDEEKTNQTLVIWAAANVLYDGNSANREFRCTSNSRLCLIQCVLIP